MALDGVNGGNPVREAIINVREANEEAAKEIVKAEARGAKKIANAVGNIKVKDLASSVLGIPVSAGRAIGKAVGKHIKNEKEAQAEAKETMNNAMGFKKTNEPVPRSERTDR